MIIEYLVICSLTFTAPYFDCDEKWSITLVSSPEMLAKLCKSDYVFEVPGCASMLVPQDLICTVCPKPILNKIYMIYPELPGTLAHELSHLKCRCDWHANTDSDLIKWGLSSDGLPSNKVLKFIREEADRQNKLIILK